jgi:hypothetical protein
MLKFANVALEFLLEFGMRYPRLFLAIDKCCMLIRCCLLFYFMNFILLLLFDNILYRVY